MAELTPFALKDAPALIEAAYPAQKISYEAQAERKAVAAQTLTGLGSYWKGRKPLILVRSIILGCLLPQTEDTESDLEVFEMLMGFDIESLAKRALKQNVIKPVDFAAKLKLRNPWDYFSHNVKNTDAEFNNINNLEFPIDSNTLGLKLRWRRDLEEDEKLIIYRQYLEMIEGYEEKACLCKRPEEVNQDWLNSHIWPRVNAHLKSYGIKTTSIQDLIEQLGLLRYNHRPRVGDTFSGGGSIPFEAARSGCDSYASDLNPIACMLTWGGFNLIGAPSSERKRIEQLQIQVSDSIDKRITDLKIEHDSSGNRAKAFLYCVETKCPETGWIVPLSPSWVISPKLKAIAKLVPNPEKKCFDIQVESGVSNSELKAAENGTVQNGDMVYSLAEKTYRTPIKTLRGDFRTESGKTSNQLRKWSKTDFAPLPEDIFQERLYAIQWITADSLEESRQITYFKGVTVEDIEREKKVENIVRENLEQWQLEGLIPDMEIDPGEKTDEPIRTRGWTHWHHLYNARQLLLKVIAKSEWLRSQEPHLGMINIAKMADFNSRLCRWAISQGGGLGGPKGVFSNQALNTFYNYATRSWAGYGSSSFKVAESPIHADIHKSIVSATANQPQQECDLWITDPPYADAVNYHEITEFFIAWLRKNPPSPFNEWTWDSRRALAIKGIGDEFRKNMAEAYSAMATNMPDNGMQCVMFTHQDTGVWSDMIGIFWAAGLQVVGAWYIATETTSELKKGGYVQGTVILMLRKRPPGERAGFKQRLMPAVRAEVKKQIETMMHLNDEVKDKMGEPVFNDSDLQMAGYAAALKVLTSYTHISGEDVTTFALRPRSKGEVTVVDEIVQQAAEAANGLLVPDGLSTNTWQKLSGIQRFYLRMMDIETTGAAKLDNYQNFAKAFRVEDYSRVMGSMAANKAQLKRITEFVSRDLTESNEIGSTWLGHLIISLQQLLAEAEPQSVISQLQADLPDFMEIRTLLIDMLLFIENKAPEKEARDVAEILGARLKNMRALGN
ncbi:anti-phage-associated DUF1156 domain-containing protein [Pseudoalteromonas sp. XMcav1-K]|uniref:anti-phage-associated DUF1156 domain-containing protein n=1 Tax=Pseudoalteromonas sp. XMcav1-K TaxID=3374372 RepID=UPI003756CEE4